VNDTARSVSLLGKAARVAQSVEESSYEPESSKDGGGSGVVQTYEDSAWIIGVVDKQRTTVEQANEESRNSLQCVGVGCNGKGYEQGDEQRFICDGSYLAGNS
jgi:hypothetical protein